MEKQAAKGSKSTSSSKSNSDDESSDLFSSSTLHWLPANHPGYVLFPNGFPDLDKVSVKQVAVKPLDFPRLRDTQKKLQRYLTESPQLWWDATLTRLEQQDKDECQTCKHYRVQQKESCKLRTDNDETTKKKSKLRYEADKAFLQHLQDSEGSHRDYPKSILFPPSRFRWSNGAYQDLKQDTVELDDKEKQLVATLLEQRREQETHYVGMTKMTLANRSTEAKYSRPSHLKPGQIVVVRSAEPEKLPFYVGEVVSPPRYNNHDDNAEFDECGEGLVDICEYGCPEKDMPNDPSKIKWRATFKGTESVRGEMKTRDEFRLHYNSKPSTIAMKPLVRTIFISCIAEFDEPDRMLTKPSSTKSTASRKLQDWVKTVLNDNPRVNWTRPVSGKKRKKNQPDTHINNKKSKK